MVCCASKSTRFCVDMLGKSEIIGQFIIYPRLQYNLMLKKIKYRANPYTTHRRFSYLYTYFNVMSRNNYTSGAKWEDIVGYSRAVKVGNTIEVSGTVATDDNNSLVGGNNAYEQTRFILQKIDGVLKKAGSSMKDVVRTRMFVTDISRWEEYGKAHGEFFSSVKPCTSMIEVKGLIAPEYLIEIEVTAIIS